MPELAELNPEELTLHLQQGHPVIVPFGAIEWHGPHLPLGLDGLVSERFAASLALKVNGLTFPGIWLPMTTLPHPSSLQVSTDTFKGVVEETLNGLIKIGAHKVILLTGHYAQGQLYELYVAAERVMDAHPDVLVFAATPLEPIGDDDLLDHAGRVETSLLLALYPDLVHLDRLPFDFEARSHAVLGESPHLATAEQGKHHMGRALACWDNWLVTATRTSLKVHYDNRRQALNGYRNAFYTESWEQAILSWWATKK